MRNLFVFFIILCSFQCVSQKVFVSKFKSQAKVRIFVAQYQSQADLVVYVTEVPSDAKNNKGIWHFERYASESQTQVFFVDDKSNADLIIYYTPNKNSAGWINKTKQNLLQL